MNSMKRILILGITVFSFLFVSCENEGADSNLQQIEIEKENVTQQSREIPCTIGTIDNIVIKPGVEKLFEVIHSGSVNSEIKWSVNSGLAQIIGSDNQSIVRVRFLGGFSIGTLRVVVNGCDLRYTMKLNGGGNDSSNPACKLKPLSIHSDFGRPVPDGYVTGNLGSNFICTTTINNELSVPFNPCASYKWEISNGGGIFPSGNSAIVTVRQPGTYRVSLETSTEQGTTRELFILYARNCDLGGGFGF